MLIKFIPLIHKSGVLDSHSSEIIDDFDYFQESNFKKSNIVLVTTDHLSNQNIFVPKEQRELSTVDVIKNIADKHPDKNFLIINNCLNMPENKKNLHFLYWAPEWITNYRNNYQTVEPLHVKKLSGSCTWISLNNNRRIHRYLSSMYMLGNNFEDFGYLSIDSSEIEEHDTWESWLSWFEYNEQPILEPIKYYFPILKKGFYKIKNNIGFQKKIYGLSTPTNNGQNFQDHLSLLYQDSLIEIINETIWYPDSGGIISEKYLNSIYGKNFPILIGVVKSIKSIRDLGFDVFDDIVDHSYDDIVDPAERLIAALDRNKKLLTDFDYSLSCWNSCQERLTQNVLLAKQIENRANDLLCTVLKHYKTYI
jgi:hypothetical protein